MGRREAQADTIGDMPAPVVAGHGVTVSLGGRRILHGVDL